MVMEFSLKGLTEAIDGVTGGVVASGLTSTVSPKSQVKGKIAACLPTTCDDQFGTKTNNAESNVEERDQPEETEVEEEKLLAYSDEPTSLYKLVKGGDWSGVIRGAQANPLEAKTWIVEKNTDGTTRWESLPLHLACENQPPVEGEFYDMLCEKIDATYIYGYV